MSADVGESFDSGGAMDFTLQAHGTNVYWALNFCGSLKGSKSTLDASGLTRAIMHFVRDLRNIA